MSSYWIVKHKNKKVEMIGSEWAVDGDGLSWTREDAATHALKCEFKEHDIPFQLVEIKEREKETIKKST